MDPDRFLNGHFPYDKDDLVKSTEWQLTETPSTFEHFCNSVHMTPYAYEFNVQPETHQNAVINVEKEVEIYVRALPEALDTFEANLVSTYFTSLTYDNSIFICKKENNLYSITVKPPLSVKYRLQIYGQRSHNENDGTLHHLFDYIINCTSTHHKVIRYPKLQGVWGVTNSFLKYGFADGFPEQASFKSERGEIKLKFPVQKNILPKYKVKWSHSEEEESSEIYVFLERNDKEVVATVRFAKTGFYKLDVYASEIELNSDLLYVMASYLIECDKPLDPCPRYPKMYGAALEYQVSLKEPLHKVLSANTEIRFRLSSPLLVRVLVDNKVMQKDENDLFDFTKITSNSGEILRVFGSSDATDKRFDGLFEFEVK